MKWGVGEVGGGGGGGGGVGGGGWKKGLQNKTKMVTCHWPLSGAPLALDLFTQRLLEDGIHRVCKLVLNVRVLLLGCLQCPLPCCGPWMEG